MRVFKKIKAFFNKKTKFQPLSRRQFYVKIINIFLGAICLDIIGQKIANIEIDYAYHRIGPAVFYGFEYNFYLFLSGLFLGLMTWRLIEIYFYGKDLLSNQ